MANEQRTVKGRNGRREKGLRIRNLLGFITDSLCKFHPETAERGVVLERLAIKGPVRAAPAKAAAAGAFTIQHLWRMTLWGATAAGALLIAVLTTQGDTGSQRMATLLSEPGKRQVAAQPFDPQAETRKLGEAVRGLTIENSQIESRLAAIEQNVDDVTGSITKQIDEVKKQAANTWPADAKPGPITPAIVASIVSPPIETPSAFGAPLPPPPAPPATQAPSDVTGSVTRPAEVAKPVEAAKPADVDKSTEYGVDVGGALSVDVLRARWLGIRSAHRRLFDGLTPTVELHQIPKSNRVELRLVVGPLDNSEAAAQLCAALAAYRLLCQPTAFDRSHIALQ
jgi:hypothetical protein